VRCETVVTDMVLAPWLLTVLELKLLVWKENARSWECLTGILILDDRRGHAEELLVKY
jgi:hypothetical protein